MKRKILYGLLFFIVMVGLAVAANIAPHPYKPPKQSPIPSPSPNPMASIWAEVLKD